MRVGYSRISDERQKKTDPLQQAERELTKAGADLVLVEVGSGKDDNARPKFRRLRDLVLDGQVTEVICPNQDRLGRNLDLVMQFVQLCQMQGVRIVDLNGRQLEVKTADGRLMTQIIGALDEHRSRLYGEKTRRHLQSARDQGKPARPRVPFGLRKIRNENGRFVGVELDPKTAPLARQRIDWFLAGNSLNSICIRAQEEQGQSLQIGQLARWLANPMLTGRLCWNKNKQGIFQQVEENPSFKSLINDVESFAIKSRLSAGQTNKAIGNRTRRMFSGLIKCHHCGRALTYKLSGNSTWYLRCANLACKRRHKMIRADQVFQVLQYSLAEHAKALVPLLQRPKVDPPEVAGLLKEIETLLPIAGTEAVIEAKRVEINKLRKADHETPAWMLIGALRSPMFWLQSDERINDVLRLLLDRATVRLGQSVSASEVSEIRCKTSPADAPLPPDQNNILLRGGLSDLVIAAHHEELMQAALDSIC